MIMTFEKKDYETLHAAVFVVDELYETLSPTMLESALEEVGRQLRFEILNKLKNNFRLISVYEPVHVHEEHRTLYSMSATVIKKEYLESLLEKEQKYERLKEFLSSLETDERYTELKEIWRTNDYDI